jgi:hypothetical protein
MLSIWSPTNHVQQFIQQRNPRPQHVVLFGHFPDLLLAQHTSWLRRLYCSPFDLLERVTTALETTALFHMGESLLCLVVRTSWAETLVSTRYTESAARRDYNSPN